jgi:hypothetical protein
LKKKKRLASSVVFDSNVPKSKVSEASAALTGGILSKNNKHNANGFLSSKHPVAFSAAAAEVNKTAGATSCKTVNTKPAVGVLKPPIPSKKGGVSANWKELLKVSADKCTVTITIPMLC